MAESSTSVPKKSTGATTELLETLSPDVSANAGGKPVALRESLEPWAKPSLENLEYHAYSVFR
jgi:hypothetical protein